jgi:hypothetical protein
MDTENGFLLSLNMDRLFVSGLITFTIEGGMIISPLLEWKMKLNCTYSRE